MSDPAAPLLAPRPRLAGRVVVLALIGAGVLAATAAWVFYQRLQAPVIELWGHAAAQRFGSAPQVELFKLVPFTDEPAADFLDIDAEKWRVAERRDVTRARGIDHVRHAMVNRRSFAWDEPRGDCQPQWQYALRFTDPAGSTTLALAPECARLRLVETGVEISVRPLMLAGKDKRQGLHLNSIFDEWLEK